MAKYTGQKIAALANLLDVKPTEVFELAHTPNAFRSAVDGSEYLVLTDQGATDAAYEAIEEGAWAFNTDFILAHSKIKNQRFSRVRQSLSDMQSALCEDANEIVLALLQDFESFAADAIKADGRGHFLSPYDGQEQEVRIDDQTYFIYRTN